MSGRLEGARIGVLMESDFYEPEIFYYQRRFAEEGAEVRFLTRLWGQRSITFQGHEYKVPFTVTGSVEGIDDAELDGYSALIVPAAMVADRLRYSEDVDQLSPATELIRRAFARPGLIKGVICHGMWLLSAAPHLVQGRKVVCHNNLIGDVRNMGATYVDQDVVVDGDLVTARTGDDCNTFAHTIIEMIEDRRAAYAPEPQVATQVATPAPTRAADRTRSVPAPARSGAPYSDMISGVLGERDEAAQTVKLTTAEGHEHVVHLDAEPNIRLLHNLDEPETGLGASPAAALTPGRMANVTGLFYPDAEGGARFDAKEVLLAGTGSSPYRFEEGDWWIRQLEAIARFYRRAQFGDGPIDFAQYRTVIRLGGDKGGDHVQETDTISRLVYGMATAYLLTGKDEYLEIAEKGTQYLRDHMRFPDTDEDVVYWYHGIRVNGANEHPLLASEFGDDYLAIPMYEQIYALAGPVQTFRVTGDHRIRSDVEATLRLFERFYADPVHGGYFSHIDPTTLRPDAGSLGGNALRKNWNSVGDHAPAYLINYYLATGDPRAAAMLEDTQDTVAARFPASDSPFVQERFHADWTADSEQGWQQDRAVVGHNLKIAWNLTRVDALRSKSSYADLAGHIGRTMPAVGADRQRGGWYDVVERVLRPGEDRHRFAWHDRKAWWQQEQAILAYLVLHAASGDPEFLQEARRAQFFYNAAFLDHDEGGVYFNATAAGLPYLLGTERLKGSHSMSMYHSSELCYLAAVYNNLLIFGKPMTMHFKPEPAALPGRILRVSPDLLPAGRVRIGQVTVDGREHTEFDAAALTVRLPDTAGRVKVRVRLDPVGGPGAPERDAR